MPRCFHLLFSLVLVIILTCCQDNDNESLSSSSDDKFPTASDAVKALDKASSFLQNNNDSIIHYTALAIKISKKEKDYYQLARAISLQASYHRRKGNYIEAVELYREAISIYATHNNQREAIKTRLVLSDIYKEMGGERGTVEYLEKGLQYAVQATMETKDINYKSGMVLGLNMQGIILRDLYKQSRNGSYMDSAYARYSQGMQIVQTTGEGIEYLGKLYNNLSQVYNEYYRDYDKALELLFKAEIYNQQRNNQNSLSFNYGNISDVYLRKGELGKASEYAHSMLEITRKLESPHRILNAYSQLVRVYKSRNRFDSALYYKELYTSISDSLTNIEKASRVVAIDTKYETREKDSQIGYLNRLSQESGQRLLFAVIAGIVLALFLGVMVYQNRKLKKKKELIVRQSERLEWLMKELHHRVKNNLQVISSLLNLQVYRTKDEVSAAALKESQLRVQAMSLIHQQLYQVNDITLVNFKHYLVDLAESLMKAYGFQPGEFDLVLDVKEEYLDVDTVMPLGLLVNELLTNAFKYAYTNIEKPLLQIKLVNQDKHLKLEIRDNGPGFTNNMNAGFGTRLVKALTKQLKANYVIKNDGGMIYHIDIPYAKTNAA